MKMKIMTTSRRTNEIFTNVLRDSRWRASSRYFREDSARSEAFESRTAKHRVSSNAPSKTTQTTGMAQQRFQVLTWVWVFGKEQRGHLRGPRRDAARRGCSPRRSVERPATHSRDLSIVCFVVQHQNVNLNAMRWVIAIIYCVNSISIHVYAKPKWTSNHTSVLFLAFLDKIVKFDKAIRSGSGLNSSTILCSKFTSQFFKKEECQLAWKCSFAKH